MTAAALVTLLGLLLDVVIVVAVIAVVIYGLRLLREIRDAVVGRQRLDRHAEPMDVKAEINNH